MVNANIGFVLIKALYYFYTLLEYAILARCILSWLPIGQNNIFARILVAITEPIMGPIRKLIYNFSPVLALLVIMFIYRILASIIYGVFF